MRFVGLIRTGAGCLLVACSVALAACRPQIPPNQTRFEAVTPRAPLNTRSEAELCQLAADAWEQDWQAAIQALATLEDRTASAGVCLGSAPLPDRLYQAYLALGDQYAQRGDTDQARSAYQKAAAYRFNDPVIAVRLAALTSDALVEESSRYPTCSPEVVSSALSETPPYSAVRTGAFVRVQADSFVLEGSPWVLHGVQYFPRDFPGSAFFAGVDEETLDFELALIRSAGLNTLRIELPHQVLFQCPGNGAVPVPAALARLDLLIASAARQDLRLLLVLNVDADLQTFPLYDAPLFVEWQMIYLAERYRSEATIIGYDLRSRGDDDYANGTTFTREQVLLWLLNAAQTLRTYAPDHLLTAGWDDEAEVTAPIVDFVSFQHFGDLVALRQEIAVLQASTQRPIVLAAFGFSTQEMDSAAQQYSYQQALEAANRNALAGWVAWAAFDYPTDGLCSGSGCTQALLRDSQFGLWTLTYFPKPALDILRQSTASARP